MTLQRRLMAALVFAVLGLQTVAAAPAQDPPPSPNNVAAADAVSGDRLNVPGAVPRSIGDRIHDAVNAADFGVRCDGVDHSAAMQAAILAISKAGGGSIMLRPCMRPYLMSFTMAPQVYLLGTPGASAQYYAGGRNVTIKAPPGAKGAVIDWPDTPIQNNAAGGGLIGIRVFGNGSDGELIGVRVRNANSIVLQDVSVQQVAKECIRIENGGEPRVEHVLAVNCWRNQALLTADAAAFYEHAEDGVFIDLEAAGSITALTSPAAHLIALWFAGDGQRISHVIGEFADRACLFTGYNAHVDSIRCEFSYAQNIQIQGHGGYYGGLFSDNASGAGRGLYHAIELAGDTNVINGWIDTTQSNWTGAPDYGLYEIAGNGQSRLKNIIGVGHGVNETIGPLHIAGSGSAQPLMQVDPIVLEANSATPDVGRWAQFRTANSAPTTITQFNGGYPGQRIAILAGDGNTSIRHDDSRVVLRNGGILKFRNGQWYEFLNVGGVWQEFSADRSGGVVLLTDADAVVTPANQGREIILDVPISAARTVTIAVDGARAGDRCRISRSADASGDSGLQIVAGRPIKSLLPGQWLDLTYSGTKWIETASGAL